MATSHGLLTAELISAYNTLGYYDSKTKTYHLEPYCKESLKDIIRFLRRDDETHSIRRYLGHAKVLQMELLPMMQHHSNDTPLFDILLRLIVNLTNPALLVYNEIIPKGKTEHKGYLEILTHLQTYKEAFNNQNAWAPLADRLGELLKKKVEDRDDDENRIIERILIVVRNILHVPPTSDREWRPDNDASVHDQVVWGLHQSGMMDLLLYIINSPDEASFYLHLTEIICLILREQPPIVLAQSASQRSEEEKNRDNEDLLKIRQQEIKEKQKNNWKYTGRHSNFGGTFVVKNMKSIGDKDLIYHKPVQDAKLITLDSNKKQLSVPKNRRSLACENTERRSVLSVRLILKQFCVEILCGAYNPLMHHVRECFHRGKTQDNDESYYFKMIKFFMEFNRHYKFEIKYVSETMSVQSFQFLQKYLETWSEMMVTDKKKVAVWSSRLHLALKAYKELLQNLMIMDRSLDSRIRESSKVIKSNIFYVMEYREMLLTLAKSYQKAKYSIQYVADLIETIHVFLKLLGDFCKGKKFIAQKPARRHTRRKKKEKRPEEPQMTVEEKWNAASSSVAEQLAREIGLSVVPFDATVEMEESEQKLEAVKKIHKSLKSSNFEEAVALLRASREIWPESDTFGTSRATHEEELDILKEIFTAELGIGPEEAPAPVDEADSDDDDTDEEEDIYPLILEQNFEVSDFVKRFASPKVISMCSALLDTFKTNPSFTNHCVAKMLFRIGWECKFPAMLFQASLFIKFRNILTINDKKHDELANLAKHVVRKFVEVAETNKIVFAEILFNKYTKDAYEIEQGYGSFQHNEKRTVWEEHEEHELQVLHDEYIRIKPSDKYVDWIMDNIINRNRSKKSVTKKLKELDLFIEAPPARSWSTSDEEELKMLFDECDKSLADKFLVQWIQERFSNKNKTDRQIKRKLQEMCLLARKEKLVKTWSEEQDDELKNLFESFREAPNPIGGILSELSVKRSKFNVIQALLRLELIRDKSEVLKSRNKSKASRLEGGDHESGSDSDRELLDSDSSSSDDEDGSNRQRQKEPASQVKPPKLTVTVREINSNLDQFAYLKDGLKWLKSTFQEELDDFADINDSETPLVPLSEGAMLSVENVHFQNFLWSLGLQKPVTAQEIYWRIPAGWKREQFENVMTVSKLLIENESLTSCKDELDNIIRTISGSDDVDDVQSHSSRASSEPRRRISSDSELSDSDRESKKSTERVGSRKALESDDDNTEPKDDSTKRRRNVLTSDDDSQTGSERRRDENSSPVPSTSVSSIKNRNRKMLDSDDEDVGEEPNTDDDVNVAVRRAILAASLESDSTDLASSIQKRNRNVLDSGDDTDDDREQENTEVDVNTEYKRAILAASSDVDSGKENRSDNDDLLNGSAVKRRRNVLDSDDDEDGSRGALRVTASGNRRKKRMIIESDEE